MTLNVRSKKIQSEINEDFNNAIESLRNCYLQSYHKNMPFKHGHVVWQSSYNCALVATAAALALERGLDLEEFIVLVKDAYNQACAARRKAVTHLTNWN